MYFEALENFEWFNEPENVRFEKDSMIIYAKPKTEFWQSIHHGFQKDNGHFFFSRQENDFVFTLKWHFDCIDKFSQCGIMVRVDEKNWLKASLMSETQENEVLAVSFTVNGHSDWSGFYLNQSVEEIWFRLQRIDDDYVLFYSLDGVNFIKVKMFYLASTEDVKVGAYIANPNKDSFCAELSSIQFGI